MLRRVPIGHGRRCVLSRHAPKQLRVKCDDDRRIAFGTKNHALTAQARSGCEGRQFGRPCVCASGIGMFVSMFIGAVISTPAQRARNHNHQHECDHEQEPGAAPRPVSHPPEPMIHHVIVYCNKCARRVAQRKTPMTHRHWRYSCDRTATLPFPQWPIS